MTRYIDYDDMLKKWHDLGFDEISRIHKVNAFNHFIRNLPTADVEEVKHAQIVRNERNIAKMKEFHEKGIGSGMSEKSIFWTCSECGSIVRPYDKYCSECGAKMDGGKANGW